MDLHLAGKRAVVTGGSAGIGAAIVRTLAAEGAEVFFCGRRQEAIDSLLAGLPQDSKVYGTALDVCDNAAVEAWLAAIGHFDIFIPNVSAIDGRWETSLAVDLTATLHNTGVAIPYLRASKAAAICYIGSVAASHPAPHCNGYGAVKAALAHHMKSLSGELLPQVRVNTVSPGCVEFADGYWDRIRESDPQGYQAMRDRYQIGRFATPEEVARVVAFIVSPAASFVSGANWYVDGGFSQMVQI